MMGMRTIWILSIAALLGNNTACAQKSKSKNMENTTAMPQSIHGFVVKDINGNDFDLSELKGKKVMIVNTASKCGLTPQYEQLQALYEEHGGDRFTIVGFPANNFLGQEPGSEEEIAAFCQKNYGVTFPMMSKISVKGNDMHPLYQWLTKKEHNGVADNDISWNFEKILIDENGKYVRAVEPRTLPNDSSVINWITGK